MIDLEPYVGITVIDGGQIGFDKLLSELELACDNAKKVQNHILYMNIKCMSSFKKILICRQS